MMDIPWSRPEPEDVFVSDDLPLMTETFIDVSAENELLIYT